MINIPKHTWPCPECGASIAAYGETSFAVLVEMHKNEHARQLMHKKPFAIIVRDELLLDIEDVKFLKDCGIAI